MIIIWDKPYKQKYITLQKTEWERGEYRFLNFSRTPLGWDANIGRFSVSYDNFGKVSEAKCA